MAVTKGTNSYVTVEEADAYFADRLDVAVWVSADPAQKGQALMTATSMLDEMTWAGSAISESQFLAFPRTCEYFDPKLGMMVFLDGTITPQRVINATYELAYHLLNNDGLLDNTGSVEEISIGPIRLSGLKSASPIPSHVSRSIKPLLVNAGANLWWRAN